jgi:hypothetical protein
MLCTAQNISSEDLCVCVGSKSKSASLNLNGSQNTPVKVCARNNLGIKERQSFFGDYAQEFFGRLAFWYKAVCALNGCNYVPGKLVLSVFNQNTFDSE